MALSLLTTIAQTIDYTTDVTTTNVNTGAAAGIGMTLFLFYFVFIVFYVVCSIKIFQKAGRKWWEAIIPIYSTYVLLQIIGRPVWWLLLFFVPFVNVVIAIIISLDLAKVFGKDTVFAILGLILFSFVGYPVLAFGSAEYAGPLAGSDGTGTPPPVAPVNNTPSTPPSTPSDQPPATPPSAPPTNLVQ